jgi:hypothetical protein
LAECGGIRGVDDTSSFSFSLAHTNMGVNKVETALFEIALEIVKKKRVLQVIELRYQSVT